MRPNSANGKPPRFSIIIPTYNHGELLRYSVQAIREQTESDWELFIIGDGVTDETRAVATQLAAEDARIRFIDHPKHPRRGEPYRHAVLTKHARGRYVCYSCDDDLWLPDHLAYMADLLRDADWAHPLSCYVDAQQRFNVRPLNLQLPYYRQLMLGRENRIGLTSMAHTMEFYRRLPYGWRTTPVGALTDHYMYQQFLQQPAARVTSGIRPTVINFPDGFRKHYAPGQKLAELKDWFSRMHEPNFTHFMTEQLMHAAYQQLTDLESELLPKVRAVIDARDQAQKHNAILKADFDTATANYKHYRADTEQLRELVTRYQRDITALQRAVDVLQSRARPTQPRDFRSRVSALAKRVRLF